MEEGTAGPSPDAATVRGRDQPSTSTGVSIISTVLGLGPLLLSLVNLDKINVQHSTSGVQLYNISILQVQILQYYSIAALWGVRIFLTDKL